MREGLTRTFSVDSKTFLLADTDNSYQSHFRPVLPNRTDLAGSDDLAGEPHVRVWRQDDFSGGMGDRIWNAANNGYYDGTVRVTSTGTLVLPADSTDPGVSIDVGVLVPISGDETAGALVNGGPYLWALDQSGALLYRYDQSDNTWGDTVTAGNASYLFPSLRAIDERVFMGGLEEDVTDGNRVIYVVNTVGSALNSAHYNNASATYDFIIFDNDTAVSNTHPVLEVFNDRLFALNGNDLWEIDLGTGNTRTSRETGMSYPDYDTFAIPGKDDMPLRITSTDVGVAWIERFGAFPRIRHYNAYTDATSEVGKLPVNSGFAELSLHYSPLDDTMWAPFQHGGKVYLASYGSITSYVGPFETAGRKSGAAYAVVGEYGPEIFVVVGITLFSYNRSTSAISVVADSLTGITEPAVGIGVNWGSSVVVPPDGLAQLWAKPGGGQVFLGKTQAATSTVIRLDKYDSTGFWESGVLDFQYPGLTKILTEVTIETEPLPANTSIKLHYRSDGGDWREDTTNLHSTLGATTYRWHMAADSTEAVGKEFEFKLTFTSSNTANTPELRSITASVTGVERRRQWQLLVDTADHDGGSGAHVQASYSVLADLNTLGNGQAAVTFSNPFEERDSDVNASHTVIVRDVVVGAEGMRADQALLVLEETELYPPSATDFYWDDLQG